MQLSDVINIASDVALVIYIVVFGFAALRALSIGRALVNRVYRNRTYFTGAFAIIAVAGNLLGIEPQLYLLNLFFFFILIDTAILVALEMDFFHRNTLRWKQIRLVGYVVFLVNETISVIETVGPLTGVITPSTAQYLETGPLTTVSGVCLLIVLAYTTATAVVSARRTPDKPLRRFIVLAGLLIFIFLVNTVVFGFVTKVFAFFFCSPRIHYLSLGNVIVSGEQDRERNQKITPVHCSLSVAPEQRH